MTDPTPTPRDRARPAPLHLSLAAIAIAALGAVIILLAKGMPELVVSRRFTHLRTSLAGVVAIVPLVALLLFPAGASAAGGSIWTIVPSANASKTSVSNNVLSGVSALSDSDVWAVGYFNSSNGGAINHTLAEHWNGTTWSVVQTPNVGTLGSQLQGVSALSDSDVWAVGNFSTSSTSSGGRTLIEHYDGTAWSVVSSPSPSTQGDFLTGVAALASDNVWAVGWLDSPILGTLSPLILHWDGAMWSVTPGVPGAGNILEAITALSPTDIWAVGESAGGGNNFELHWNGSKWTVTPFASFPNGGQQSLRGVAAASSTDVWAVGSYAPTVFAELQTLAVHWDGTRWSRVPTPNVDAFFNLLLAVAAVNSNDVWAVGYAFTTNGLGFATLTERWDGQQWSIVPSPNVPSSVELADQLDGVVWTGGTSLWAVGSFDSFVQGNPGLRTLTEHTTQG
jgi:hypothetical protein